MAPALTCTADSTAVMKPGSVNVTSYVPGGSVARVNMPAPSVTAVRAGSPVAWRAATVTPGRMRPVASVTVPEMAASWAWAMLGASITKAKPVQATVDICRKYFIGCLYRSGDSHTTESVTAKNWNVFRFCFRPRMGGPMKTRFRRR